MNKVFVLGNEKKHYGSQDLLNVSEDEEELNPLLSDAYDKDLETVKIMNNVLLLRNQLVLRIYMLSLKRLPVSVIHVFFFLF